MLVLLDEPFANLDAALRVQLRDEVRAILHARHASALFVTHDQTDALTVADRVAVMHAGRIEQVDTPERIYGSPATVFVATFVGVANLVPATVRAGAAETPLGSVAVDPAGRDGRALVVIRPEHLEIDPAVAPAGGAAGGVRGVPGRVTARRFAGSELLFQVAIDAEPGYLWAEAGPLAHGMSIHDPVTLRMRARRTTALFSDA